MQRRSFTGVDILAFYQEKANVVSSADTFSDISVVSPPSQLLY
jgi:hypothetical protein